MTNPTDEQVERVARSIAEQAVNDSESWRNYTYAARAAIAAMPSPTVGEAARVLLENGDALSDIAIEQMRANAVKDGSRIGYLPSLIYGLQALNQTPQEGE